MEKDLIASFKKKMDIQDGDLRSYSPLTFAYIGDAVYDLLIRTEIVSKGNTQVNKYHKMVSNIVKAEAQANLIHGMLEYLTEEEMDIYKRGRNANSYTKAKNASMGVYRRATGFEALIGYLYMKQEYERIAELIALGREHLDEM